MIVRRRCEHILKKGKIQMLSIPVYWFISGTKQILFQKEVRLSVLCKSEYPVEGSRKAWSFLEQTLTNIYFRDAFCDFAYRGVSA